MAKSSLTIVLIICSLIERFTVPQPCPRRAFYAAATRDGAQMAASRKRGRRRHSLSATKDLVVPTLEFRDVVMIQPLAELRKGIKPRVAAARPGLPEEYDVLGRAGVNLVHELRSQLAY